MGLRVDIYGLDNKADQIKEGSLVYDGKEITATSENVQGILDDTVGVRGRGLIKATDDPEAFLHALQFKYKSIYCLATAPEET